MSMLRLQLSQQEHGISWLELFYDLAYVAIIVALGDWLSHNISIGGIAGFLLIFIPVWRSWVGTVFFFNRFDQNDVGGWLLVFLQMYFLVGLATHMRDPLGELSRGFAISFVLVLVVQILMYVRAWGAFPEARPLIKRYILGDVPLALIWLISAFLPPPYRFVLWGGGILWGISVPMLPQMRRWGERFRPDLHHLSERVGQFTIIVLGESFIKVVSSVLGDEEHALGLNGGLSMVIVACLWWVYFDLANSGDPGEAPREQFGWFVAHLPLAIGVTALGVAIKTVDLVDLTHVLENENRYLFLGSLAFCWMTLAVLDRVMNAAPSDSRRRLVLGRILVVALLIGIGLVGENLEAGWMLFVTAATGVVLVAQEVYWRTRKSADSRSIETIDVS